MRKTYAYNSITIGILVALLVYFSTKSVVLTILAGLGVAVVGFIVIRFLENALSKGVDKAVGKVSEAYRDHKAQKYGQTAPNAAQTTQFPNQAQTTQFPGAVPVQPAAQPAGQGEPQPAATQPDPEYQYCPYCGAQIKRSSKFCPSCGHSLGA